MGGAGSGFRRALHPEPPSFLRQLLPAKPLQS
jgi:hypothetical protein